MPIVRRTHSYVCEGCDISVTTYSKFCWEYTQAKDFLKMHSVRRSHALWNCFCLRGFSWSEKKSFECRRGVSPQRTTLKRFFFERSQGYQAWFSFPTPPEIFIVCAVCTCSLFLCSMFAWTRSSSGHSLRFAAAPYPP